MDRKLGKYGKYLTFHSTFENFHCKFCIIFIPSTLYDYWFEFINMLTWLASSLTHLDLDFNFNWSILVQHQHTTHSLLIDYGKWQKNGENRENRKKICDERVNHSESLNNELTMTREELYKATWYFIDRVRM